jgi:hypothetical protein
MVILNTSVGANWISPGTFSYNTSIKASHYVVAEGFLGISDSRIKRDILVSDASKDLQTLMKLKVSDYHYIDWMGRGTQLKKGFIAQEVKEIFPDAVATKAKEIIPSVYARAVGVTKGIDDLYSICTPSSHGFAQGDKVKLITPKGEIVEQVTSVEGENCFSLRTTKISSPDSVFVFGKEVNDFHSVDYDQIHTLSVSAIQELNKKLEAEIAKNKEQNAQIELLKAELEKATAKNAKSETKTVDNSSVEARLNALTAELEKLKSIIGAEAKKD